jgi:hypothetical protein
MKLKKDENHKQSKGYRGCRSKSRVWAGVFSAIFFFFSALTIGARAASAQSWTELFPTGAPPDPLFVPKPAFYDATSNRLIVFFPGVPGAGGFGNQVWVLTNANGLGAPPQWIQLFPSGSPPFSNGLESAVYDAATNRLIVYGGCAFNCSPALSQVFVLTHANGLGGAPEWTQSAVTNPQARTYHSAVLDSANNLMIAFGGHFAFFGNDQNDTRTLSNANGVTSPSSWSTLATSGGPPSIRALHSTVYDAANNRMVLYAGANLQKNFCCGFPFGNMVSDYGDLWVLGNASGIGGTPTWAMQVPAGPSPPSRFSHTAVYDELNNRMLVFGGVHVVNFFTQTLVLLGDIWVLDHANGLGGTPTWTQLFPSGTPPGPRSTVTAAFDAANQRMILLGGRDENDIPSNRVWVLALNQPPVADAGADQTVACTGASGTQVMLDGSASSDPDNDELSYTWTGPFPEGGGTVIGVNPSVTLPLGKSTIHLTVDDGKGGTSSDSVVVEVIVGVEGLLPPLSALVPEGALVPLPDKASKQGSTLPLKLRLCCGATPLTDANVAAPKIVALTRSGDPVDLATVDLDAGESNDSGVFFRYSEPNWVFNLSTAGLSRGSYVITIELPDGRRYSAGFVLR